MTGQPVKRCDYCHEVILAGARKCKHCGETLDPELRKAEAKAQRMPIWYPLLTVLLVGLGIIGLGYLVAYFGWTGWGFLSVLLGLAVIALGLPLVLILRAVGRTMNG